MSTSPNPPSHQRMQELERVILKIEQSADTNARALLQELIQALMDLHGEALARIRQRLDQAGDAGRHILDDLATDDVVASLLLLYGLHPQDADTRARNVLRDIEPDLRLHGGQVEFLGVSDGVVSLRLQETGRGELSSLLILKELIEQAIFTAVPEITTIELQEVAQSAGSRNGKLALPTL